MTFTPADLDHATATVRRHMGPTPLYRWPLLRAETGVEVWVKHENHTPIGAFKVRGGLVLADRIARAAAAAGDPLPGIVSATRGNHGQSLAFAGRAYGIAVTIVVPFGNSPDKNAAMRGFGAEVVEHGHDFQAAREYSAQLATERGLLPVHAYQDELVLGVATYARELFEQYAATESEDLDAVYVGVGMGSAASGLIQVRDQLGLRTEIVAVVAANAPATALSFAAGHPVSTDTADTFLDGLACRVPDPTAIEILNKGLARVVEVSEDDGAEAMRVMLRTTHNVAEPAGASALAGLLAEREAMAGKRVAVIHSGGNADSGLLLDVLSGRTPTLG